MTDVPAVPGVLATRGPFVALDRPEREALAACGQLEVVGPGTALLREGDIPKRFYLLCAGRVSLQVHAPGRDPLVVETVGPGELVGWSWLFPPTRGTVDAVTSTACELVSFDAEAVHAACASDPVLGHAVMRAVAHVLVDRLRATRLRLLDLYARPAPGPPERPGDAATPAAERLLPGGPTGEPPGGARR